MDFGRNVEITAIATQGRNTPAHPQWVTSYTLSVSNDGSVWMPYREESAMKVNIDKYYFDKSSTGLTDTDILQNDFLFRKHKRKSEE